MDTFKHTPGPWTLQTGDRTHRFSHVVDSDDRTIVYKYGSGRGDDADQDEVNFRLIAAAPQLLEALELALGTYRQAFTHSGTGRNDPQPVPDPEWVTQVRAAIAAATGETPHEGQ